jgi:hypothetical protein
LWPGFSILSGVEIIYYLLKFIASAGREIKVTGKERKNKMSFLGRFTDK